MDVNKANEMLDLVERLTLIGAEITALIVASSGKSVDEIRQMRDAISAETHRIIEAEKARLDQQ